MCVVYTFVSERAADLEDLVLSTYNQTFEIQLRCYPQFEWGIGHLIRDRFEGSGDCAASVEVEHGCFDFEEAGLNERCSYVVVDQRAQSEDVGWLVARERVDVRASGKRFGIVDFVGDVVQAGREDMGHLQGEDGQLT